MNKAVSDYMREMQRRSAEARWSGMTAADEFAEPAFSDADPGL